MTPRLIFLEHVVWQKGPESENHEAACFPENVSVFPPFLPSLLRLSLSFFHSLYLSSSLCLCLSVSISRSLSLSLSFSLFFLSFSL